jgi:phosphatidate cytidylyltransferase
MFIPLLLWVLYQGGLPLVILFLIMAVLGFYEYIVMMSAIEVKIGYQWLFMIAFSYLAAVYTRSFDMVIFWGIFITILISTLVLWSKQKSVVPMLATFFGIIYTGILPAMIVRVGLDYSVQKILLALILMIWIVDSVAYFIGMRFGKHRNVTPISPKKSIEGFIAGAITPFILSIALYFGGFRLISLHSMLLISLSAGIVGQLGDLCESMLKRYCGVKDSSNFIPGHGGVLDRLDSALLAGSFLYCALALF